MKSYMLAIIGVVLVAGVSVLRAGETPAAVDGLKMTLSVSQPVLACSDGCREMSAGGTYHPCAGAGCKANCEGRLKLCWHCAAASGLCQVCGREKVPASMIDVKTIKAGEAVTLAITFENVSQEDLRVCKYLLTMTKIKWNVTGPDKDSVKTTASGLATMLALVSELDYPTLAPGGKIVFPVSVGGNPPAINQFGQLINLLKGGQYRVSATYDNQEDTYLTSTSEKVQVLGKVWKGELTSNILTLNVEGEIKPLTENRLLLAHPVNPAKK